MGLAAASSQHCRVEVLSSRPWRKCRKHRAKRRGSRMPFRHRLGPTGIRRRAVAATPWSLLMKEQSEPDREVEAAQAAGTILAEIGLEMRMCCRISRDGRGPLRPVSGTGVPLAQDKAGESGLVQLLVEGKLSGEKTGGLKWRELEIVRIETPISFTARADRAEADVPHALE